MYTKAFTIVELIITIIVIAILASVTTVAFNGVQQRATNESVIVGLNKVEDFWNNYYTKNNAVLRLHPDDVQAAAAQSTFITDPYYTIRTERAGVCIGQSWPSQFATRNQGTTEAMWDYCDSAPNNTNINRGMATDLFDKAVQRSGVLKTSLPNMPSINPVDLWPSDKSSPIKQRGIRLANMVENKKTYLFYPLYGNDCVKSDRRVRFTATQWIDFYGSTNNDIAAADFDADFTQNNTVYCARTLEW